MFVGLLAVRPTTNGQIKILTCSMLVHCGTIQTALPHCLHCRSSMAASSVSDRKMRGFRRWMKNNGIECSDTLLLSAEIGGTFDSSESLSISVKALCDLKVGDVVGRIPKLSCLTVRTSAASNLIEEAQLDGNLGLAVAIMYERSLGPRSKWFQYLEILPPFEPIPLLWSNDDIDSLLVGTEIHEVVKEDKHLVYQDWKDCIKPLLDSASHDLRPEFFTIDAYFAAKSLIASRSFQIDEYHGFGMVPLADLFNHKTAAENVHFTAVSSCSESDNDTEVRRRYANNENDGDEESISPDSHPGSGGFVGSDLDLSSTSGTESTFREMIIVENVPVGAEVFNTYGCLGNAALLHRYGFTEPDNPYDIVNLDLDIVVQWSSSMFSCRRIRRRLKLWRNLGYSGCSSQDSEYFEISFDGEPQLDLLVLLYILLLPEAEFHNLDLAFSVASEVRQNPGFPFQGKEGFIFTKDSKISQKLLLMQSICQALLALTDAREALYGPDSLDNDIKSFEECCQTTDPRRYYSLILRIGEKRIIGKLRSLAASGAGNLTSRGTRKRGRMKGT